MTEKTKWPERIFGKKLLKCDSTNNSNDFDALPTMEVLKNVHVTGVYFSFANINTQSDDFQKKLRDLYDKLNASCANGDSDKRFEVIQVVMWAHNDNYGDFEISHRDSLLGLPWFAMPFSEINLKVWYVSNKQCDSRSTELKDVHSHVGKSTIVSTDKVKNRE